MIPVLSNFATAVLSLAAVASSAPTNVATGLRHDDADYPRTVAVLVPDAVSLQTPVAVADLYSFYRGDGSIGAGWPDLPRWGSYDQLWSANLPLIQRACRNNGWGADNSAAEVSSIKSAIEQVSGQTGVDKRYILAIMMEESKGCVRVPTTNNGVVNPGLMQSHNGAGSCAGINDCAQDKVFQMIRDGVAGTSSGDGLQQLIKKASAVTGGTNSRAYYAAARLYNSGSANYQNLDDGRGSTGCYSSDIANRLTGWTLAASQCYA